ncbi:beta-ketoacyl-[acyl-carrier-protein] synthase family protein [Novosphingobium pentaromativorans]|uniref:Nodulation protein E n=1 Tax=Novosphingobium pentaromativorans US6-1 TaxID=1088721 RepID=G6EGV7_9SPHN|nr:beta-ketoacyl-[acyl-carrier-protein] synthase family protein [Novosphingobium pentaromativorans]AIT82051.1 3-oxoacyl-ACP synthase [Novosphingobium pentaromativorans US6-1]EHJ59246.1 3-oxoacyl-[acyl-carrier-protein] synthase II [Novosphingobium pentaromativorans US6-1]
MRHRVVITGMGCISGLGKGLEANWAALRAGASSIRPIAREGMEGIASWIAEDGESPRCTAAELRPLGKLDPISRHAIEAASEAVDQSGLADHPVLRDRTAILIGCGSGGNATIDAAYQRLFGQGQAKVHPQTIPASMIAAPAAHIAMLYKVHGPAFTLSSACASSAHALGEAMHMIRSGRVEVAIAGGAEACLSQGSWTAWRSLGVLAPDACRPFSLERKGMVLGEGAAVLVLESEEHALSRGATIIAELAGYGASSDAAHMTAPDVEGIAAAIRAAHADAGAGVEAPSLISAHGTGTQLNDPAEAAAMRSVYGKGIDRHSVIATKSAHGHMIGAAGAMEFLLGIRCLVEGLAPPVLNHLGTPADCALPLVLSQQSIDHEVLVSNSFAFGGLNAVLIGRKP